MRNRIARLITIGLTTVSMTLTALSGAAPITLTAQAAPNDPATQATPNGGDPVATRGGVTYERDYDKGALANGRKVVNYEDKYGAKDNYPNKYKGAELNLPDYSDATKRGYKIDEDPSHYTFTILQPQVKLESATQLDVKNDLDQYAVFSVDRKTQQTLYVKVFNKKTGALEEEKQIPVNSGIPGYVDFLGSFNSGNLRYDNNSLASHNAMGLIDNRYNIRSMFDSIYFDGSFLSPKRIDLNGSYRIFTLDASMKNEKQGWHVATDGIPVESTQTTYYIGILEDGTQIRLDTFQIKGLTGEKYHAPTPNTYKGWVYERAVYAERPGENEDVSLINPTPMKDTNGREKTPSTLVGELGKSYKKGYYFEDNPTDGYIRRLDVVDDQRSVVMKLYRRIDAIENTLSFYKTKINSMPASAKIMRDGVQYVLVKESGIMKQGDPDTKYKSGEDTDTFGPVYLNKYSNGTYKRLTYVDSNIYGVVNASLVYEYRDGTMSPINKNIALRNPIQEEPQDIIYYYKLAPEEPVSPETPGVESEGARTTIKKALELKNIAHDYIPSVPDVTFNYEVIYDRGTVVYDDGTDVYGKDKTPVGYLVQGVDANGFPTIRVGVDKGVATDIYDDGPDSIYEDKKIKDSFGNEITVLDANGRPVRTLKKEALYARYTPVAYGKDKNDTEFEIWRGPIGGIKLTNAETDAQSHKGTVRFHHDDDAEKDTDGTGKNLAIQDGRNDLMTKKLQVEVVENAFKAPGVYRYTLLERGGDDRAMTEWDHENEKNKTTSAVLDDIEHNFDKTKNPNGEIRYLDIYVEWNGTEDKLIVKDMVLHNITGKLDYYSHGDLALGEESSQESVPLADEGKKDAFTQSTYTTYDLVVGKEIMGKGLTNYDITKRVFTFKVTINAPSYTLIKAARGAEETSGNINWRFPVPTDGVLVPYTKSKDTNREFIIKVKQGEWVLLSGIPSGSTYEVEEVDDWSDPNAENSALFENYYSSNMKEMIEDPSNHSIKALTGQNNGSMLEDQPRRNTYMMLLQGKYQAEQNEQVFEYSGDESLDDGMLFDVSSAEEKKTGTYVMTKKTEADSIDNVFFLNLRRDNVVTGVAMSVAPYALMVAAAVIGVGGFLIVKKRRDADLDED